MLSVIMLSVIMLSVIMLSVFVLSVFVLIVNVLRVTMLSPVFLMIFRKSYCRLSFMLSVVIYQYADGHYAQCQCAESLLDQYCVFNVILNVFMLTGTQVESHYAEGHILIVMLSVIMLSIVIPIQLQLQRI